MAFKLFKKKPAARIKIGSTFLGKTISATAEGYVIYKEWDKEDKKNYYWEEWELRGFKDYDSWIEYDHYTHKLSLYEPLKPQEFVDPTNLKKGDRVSFTTRRGEKIDAVVTEAGVGTVARREGTLTYHVFEGDKVAYAECSGPYGKYCIEKYNDKELDIYKSQVLTRKQQKEVLGRTVSPGVWGIFKALPLSTKLYLIFFFGFFGFSMFASAIPQYESFCTPRSTARSGSSTTALSTSSSTTIKPLTSVRPTDEVVSQDANKTCYRRQVYSSGGGGYGK